MLSYGLDGSRLTRYACGSTYMTVFIRAVTARAREEYAGRY